MDEAAMWALLERSMKRTQLMNIIIGVGVVGLGDLMMALHFFELDPEAADMSTGMVAALYGFAILFELVGFGLIYMGAVVTPRMRRELHNAIFEQPERVKRYWRWVVTSTGSDRGMGAQNYVKIVLEDGKERQVSVAQAHVEDFLAMLARKCPDAEVGPPG